MSQTAQPKTNYRRTMHYFGMVLKKYKGRTAISVLTTPVVVLTRSTLIPLIFAEMIDRISAGIAPGQFVPTLLPFALALIACYVIGSSILGFIRVYSLWKMEILAMYDLATLCFNSVCEQSMQFHSDRFSGSLVSQTNKFIGSFERFFDALIFQVIYFISLFTSIIVVLAARAPWFALGLVIFVFLYMLCSALTFKKISHLSRETAAAETRLTGQLADSVSNIIAVKSYGREAHERHRFANFNRACMNASLAQMRAQAKRDATFNLVDIGIIAIIILFLVIGQPLFGLSVSTLILIVNYSLNVMGELWDISNIFKTFNRVFGDAYEMTTILDTKKTIVDKPGAKELIVKHGAIEFRQLRFKHHDAKVAIFDNFNLSIRPGERIGLVGISGSGKTTLTKLLLRFADVQGGEICIDKQNIAEVQQVSLREHIAYVPQETSLFHRSIFDNIAYARPEASRAEVIRAAKLANADQFIRDLPEAYDTLVGERGIKLSGGQRQRIAIARAILKDAPILVLDEATSALDSESEALIQDALAKLMQGRTSIVVAHRLSTVASLDRIIVLQNGRIVEQGRHADLLKQGGAYSKLWSRQSGAFLKEPQSQA